MEKIESYIILCDYLKWRMGRVSVCRYSIEEVIEALEIAMIELIKIIVKVEKEEQMCKEPTKLEIAIQEAMALLKAKYGTDNNLVINSKYQKEKNELIEEILIRTAKEKNNECS